MGYLIYFFISDKKKDFVRMNIYVKEELYVKFISANFFSSSFELYAFMQIMVLILEGN